MKKTLTVFTCTYNRAYTISRTYESLCRQTSKDFKWLVIDDGSTDNTRELVGHWICKNKIPIKYVYKENGGLHTGYNKAIELMDTELCVCIDSDDWMPDDAVEIIVDTWSGSKANGIIGIIGRDYYADGRGVIGSSLPDVESCYIIDMMDKYKIGGDLKIVMRVDLLKNIPPQPSYNGERNFNPIYRMLQLDQYGKHGLLDKNLCFVDYQDTGMAANIFKQYINSPNSFAALRCLYISLPKATFWFRLKNIIHLSSNAILAKDLSWLNKCYYPILAWIFLPVGFLLSLYIKRIANK